MNIYALSSGRGPSGIAIVRVSGKSSLQVCKNLTQLEEIKSKICEILKVKNINITNIQTYPLTLNLKRTYYKSDVLILGEGLHTIHPVAGQGFNLVLRDIKKLKEVLKYYTGLGMSIKSSPALEDFSNQRKSENIITGIGVYLTHNFFKQNKLLNPLKDVILKNVSKNDTLKKISKFISNQGLSI